MSTITTKDLAQCACGRPGDYVIYNRAGDRDRYMGGDYGVRISRTVACGHCAAARVEAGELVRVSPFAFEPLAQDGAR